MKQEEIMALRAKADKATKLEGEIERIKKQLSSLSNVHSVQINFKESYKHKSWQIRKTDTQDIVEDITEDIRKHLESKLAKKQKELDDL